MNVHADTMQAPGKVEPNFHFCGSELPLSPDFSDGNGHFLTAMPRSATVMIPSRSAAPIGTPEVADSPDRPEGYRAARGSMRQGIDVVASRSQARNGTEKAELYPEGDHEVGNESDTSPFRASLSLAAPVACELIADRSEAGLMGPTERSYVPDRWYACRTRARAEKKVDRLLTSAGVTSYLPLIERVRQWSDRSKRVEFPLFPGYVFARFSLSALPDVVRTPNLIEVVRVNGSPSPIREYEIDSIRALVQGVERIGEEPEAHEYFARGQEVRVVQGPFEGLRGILTEVRGRTRIVVRLEAIRQAVSVEMSTRFVTTVD